MSSYKIAKRKYNNLIERSIKKKKRYFFFNFKLKYNPQEMDIIPDVEMKFIEFCTSLKDELFREKIEWHYSRFCLLDAKEDKGKEGDRLKEILSDKTESDKINDYNYDIKAIDVYEYIRKQMSKLNELKKINVSLLNTYKNEIFDFEYEDFAKWYKEDEHNRKCYYCGITENNIQDLLEKFNMNKDFMFYPRGEKMEVDRRDPIDDYSIEKDTIALCCYWCNNAKTDEFTEDEFKKIATGIKEVWEKRLRKAKIIGDTERLIPGYIVSQSS